MGLALGRKFTVFFLIFLGLLISDTSTSLTESDWAEEPELLDEPQLPGTLEATGTHFEIIDSNYLNITLDSSQPIKLMFESMSEMVAMRLESASDATSTKIILRGFAPQTTYHKYEDDYHNHVAFTTDANGNYAYTQNVSEPHLVFIQPRTGTKFIHDDATGGDCATIGIWNSSTKTCILTTDVNGAIQIDADGITLDGDGHTLTVEGPSTGIYFNKKTGITIKNFNINKFFSGIYSYDSNNIALIDNTLLDNYIGIRLLYSKNSAIIDNNISNNRFGIYIGHSNNITLMNNTSSSNSYGIYLPSSNNNTVTNNTVSSNTYGILVSDSSNNILIDNTVSNNSYIGISLNFSSNNNNIMTNNISNNWLGISLYRASDNNFLNNTVSNSSNYGINLHKYSNNNKIYNNNFINNQNQVYVDSYSAGNVFNLEAPTGGNYWSNYDSPVEGCNDADSDGFCDVPYVFTDGQDNLPWTIANGWTNACSDGIRDGDETNVDCGGSCQPCADGKSCLVDSDCESNYCNPENICSVLRDLYIEWIKPVQVVEDVDLVEGKATVVRVKVVNTSQPTWADVAINYNGWTETKNVLIEDSNIVDFYPPNEYTTIGG